MSRLSVGVCAYVLKVHIYMNTRIDTIDMFCVRVCVVMYVQDTHIHVYTHLFY